MAQDLQKQTNLFETDTPLEVEENPRSKERVSYDPDEVLAKWSQVVSDSLSNPPSYTCRLAKLKNGKRGLQFVRGNPTNPSYVGSLLLSRDEYYSLAQCIFRDSHIVRALCEATDGTSEVLEQLRRFVRGT